MNLRLAGQFAGALHILGCRGAFAAVVDPLEIEPVATPIRGTVRPPGSKSLTNRALIVAGLAQGESILTGVLESDDTRVMLDSLARLGVSLTHDPRGAAVRLVGCGGKPPAQAAELWLENSGTSMRFLTAVCSLGTGRYRLDGNARMRERPIGELVNALKQLGGGAACESGGDCPPVIVEACGLSGGKARVGGEISSQFLSALLMAVPAARAQVQIEVAGKQVSEPYVEMTLRVMAAFGVSVDSPAPGVYRVEPQTYRGREYAIEPDASAASYFFAAAAITGGEVTVAGLTRDSLQGDVRFVDALECMGCEVVYAADGITVRGGALHGIDVDMNAISDTAQTLAALAPFAAGPTRIRNIAHVRHKETDRIVALKNELQRIGQTVEEHADGLTIHPAPLRAGTVETYNDHRMAMSFALVGLRAPGVRIANPGCVGKTYPRFFEDLRRLVGRGK
ncbi:MAG: 3-phosphoshikimate 1-carboxyvinyltransferase [Planctomycetaceae bacterium]